MKDKLNNVWMRSIFSLVIGVLLVLYPGVASIYFVMALGVLFLLPGIISIITVLRMPADERSFPIIGLGSVLFGLWLLIMPVFFVAILMYALGAILVMAGLSSVIELIKTRKLMAVHPGFYIVPVLVMIAGFVVLFNPFGTAEIPFIVLGASSILYALSGMLNAWRFRKAKAVVVDENDLPQVAVELLEDDNAKDSTGNADTAGTKDKVDADGKADAKDKTDVKNKS